MKDFFKDKGLGFYFTAASAVLSLITAIGLMSFYASDDNASAAMYVLPLVAFFVAAALLVVPIFVPSLKTALPTFAPWAVLGATMISLLQFLLLGYVRVTQAAIGRDGDMTGIVGGDIIFGAIFLLLTAIAATVAVFLKTYKEQAAKAEKQAVQEDIAPASRTEEQIVQEDIAPVARTEKQAVQDDAAPTDVAKEEEKTHE